jgi:YVTN family beta-propeller protein
VKTERILTRVLGLAALALSAAAGAATEPKPAEPAKAAEKKADESKRLVRDGLIIDFEAVPVEGKELMEGSLAEVRFRFTDERTGKPVQGVRPGAWMDVGANIQGQAGAEQKECKEKIGLYLKGAVGIRPLADLNGYYLMVLNRDPSITVIDPMVSMAGRTSTLASIRLKRPPLDWANYGDAKRLFVTMPSAGKVAVVDTETLKVVQDIDAGKEPSRIVLQPDGKYLWVGNNAKDARESGVTVIDPQSLKLVKQIATGKGHHEIAVSSDNRSAYITNRDDGSVTIVDVGTLEKVKDLKTGSLPLSVAYSKLSGAAYVVDGKEGTIAVIDGAKHELVTKIKGKPGLGPLRFTPDGRFGMVVNTAESVVNVIDPASNEIIHSPKVQAEPFQVVYTTGFAYVRSLGSERVTMINLSSLGKGKQPIVQSFAAGTVAPKKGGDLPLADTMTAALGEAAAFVVSPADNATYFYMEGMNAPMSSYQGRGALGRAVTVVDRSLKETEPGLFTGRLRLPVAAHYDVALSVDQPRLVHCFGMDAKANPELEKLRQTVAVEWMPQQRVFAPKETVKVRFRVLDGAGTPKTGLKDVMVRYFLVPASAPRNVNAKEVEDGIYEAPVELSETGAYYVYVGVNSLKLGFNDSGFLSLMARPGGAPPRKAAEPTQGEKPN